MDDDTRYWLASDMADNKFHHNTDNLLSMTKLQAGKNPRNFITDGLQVYMKSSKKVFEKKTNHVSDIFILKVTKIIIKWRELMVQSEIVRKYSEVSKE